jgi:hypothetical protein
MCAIFYFPKEEHRNSEENKKNRKPKLCIYNLLSTVPSSSVLKESKGRDFKVSKITKKNQIKLY